jgi:ribonuclease HI
LSTKSKKIYAVFQGHEPGLFSDWDTASKQVKGFKGAVYKSFAQRTEAISWLREMVLAAKEPVSEHLIELIKAENLPASSTRAASSDPRIVIHTDGGASPNPGVGGYGVVLQHGTRRKELSAGYQLTTNNRMEILACIVALEALKEPSQAVLYTDSKYVVDSIMKRWAKGWRHRGWRKSNGERPENVDLWSRLLDLLEKHKVEFIWVKGHAGNQENERCDQLVNEARSLTPLLIDEGYRS